MFQPDIQIEHSWHLEYTGYPYPFVQPYSASFVDELLPDVKFSIFCVVLNESQCKLVFSKKPCRPANATVQILLKYLDKKDKRHNYSWVDDCTLECDFSVQDPRCKSCKYHSPHFVEYTFTCCITWRGFIEPKQSVCDVYGYLKHFLAVPDFSDTTIVIGEKEIPVHKIILAAYSPVFLAMFKAGMTESTNKRIVVADIEDFKDFYRRKPELLSDFFIYSIAADKGNL
ncbi:hypothetical protein PV326_014025 [Microctonus aethiopoides]|nr:hypothetical protein PV326_014025 [Microctonus aethiopoides]